MHSIGAGIAEPVGAVAARRGLGSIKWLTRGPAIQLVVASPEAQRCMDSIRLAAGSLNGALAQRHPRWQKHAGGDACRPGPLQRAVRDRAGDVSAKVSQLILFRGMGLRAFGRPWRGALDIVSTLAALARHARHRLGARPRRVGRCKDLGSSHPSGVSRLCRSAGRSRMAQCIADISQIWRGCRTMKVVLLCCRRRRSAARLVLRGDAWGCSGHSLSSAAGVGSVRRSA